MLEIFRRVTTLNHLVAVSGGQLISPPPTQASRKDDHHFFARVL